MQFVCRLTDGGDDVAFSLVPLTEETSNTFDEVAPASEERAGRPDRAIGAASKTSLREIKQILRQQNLKYSRRVCYAKRLPQQRRWLRLVFGASNRRNLEHLV
jgi:hypothetical protein